MDEKDKVNDLPPPNHGKNPVVYEVNGKPVNRNTAYRHRTGKTVKQHEECEYDKTPAELVGYFVGEKKVSRTTEWRHRTKAAKQTKAMKQQDSEHQQALKEIQEEFMSLSDADRLRYTYHELVRRLSVESHSKFITDVNWDDPNSISRRNAQLANLKNLLTVTKSMHELITQLENNNYDSNIRSKEEKKEHEKIIFNAQALLQRKVANG